MFAGITTEVELLRSDADAADARIAAGEERPLLGGIPLAVQLVGRPRDEPTLISLSAQLEAERGWALKRPALGDEPM
jgi:Asp-tRNA(Asn)/Glu-tRNA(Gln) amidotransferase A subunit family amidase